VLISHRESSIEVRQRQDDGAWTSRVFGARERAELGFVPCVLDVDAIYAAAEDPRA
jgi:hypothetical protein